MKSPPFRRDEFLETLSRIKRDQPRRYAREVSAGQQVRVANYERERDQAERQSAEPERGVGQVSSEQRREQGRAPVPDAPPTAKPGTGMLMMPACTADPLGLAEQAIERLRREHPPRPVKTSKRKRKAAQKRGPIGGGRVR